MDVLYRDYQKINPIRGYRIPVFVALFVLGCFVSEQISPVKGIELTIRLGLGVATLAYIISPFRKWIFIAGVQFTVSLLMTSHLGYIGAIVFAVSELTMALVAAVIFRLSRRITLYSRHARSVINFTLSVGIGVLTGSLLGQYLFYLFHPSVFRPHIWISWTLSGVLGIVLVVPLYLWWRGVDLQKFRQRIRLVQWELILLFLSTFSVTYLIFTQRLAFFHLDVDFPYLLFPFVFWAAVRFHPRILFVLLFVVSLVVLILGRSAIVHSDMSFDLQDMVAIEVFLLFIILFSYIMALMTLRRKDAETKIMKLNQRLEGRVKSRTSELNETMSALQQSEEQFREAFENSIQGMALLSIDGHFLRVNRALCDMLGYKSSDFLKLSMRKITQRDDYLMEMKLIKRLTKGELRFYQMEKRLIHKQKLELWALESNSMIRDSDGNPLLIVSQVVDITERIQAENQLKKTSETLTVLLREVNHRVKNNLSALISILHMEEDRADAKGKTEYIQLLQDLTGRIRGLAMVHSMLSAQNWQPLELQDLCEQIVYATIKGMSSENPLRMHVDGDSPKVTSNQAHHLALVLNELATNSLKYGIADMPNGSISVHIRLDDGRIHLIFRDNGPGYPDEIIEGNFEHASIGIELIRGTVSQSLDGEVVFKNDNGAVTELIFANELK